MVTPLIRPQVHADVIKAWTVLRIAIEEYKIADRQWG